MFDYTKDTGQTGLGNKPLTPHPDGKAWPKCCRGHVHPELAGGSTDCAFIRDQAHGNRLSANRPEQPYIGNGLGINKVKDVPFICAHRSTDDGYHRVCAGWDACFGNKAITAKTRE